MKITVYTVSDCQFSKAEKDYLTDHNLPYEEKNLEQNREWLTEMLAVSNNFAGTPVTKIEKDDGQIVVLKGFTQEEFDQVLGFKKEEPVAQASADVTVTPPASSTLTQSSTDQPPTEKSQTPQPTPPSQPTNTPPPAPPSVQTPPTNLPSSENNSENTTNQTSNPLSSVLSDLEEKSKANPQPSSPPPTNIPNIPDFNE